MINEEILVPYLSDGSDKGEGGEIKHHLIWVTKKKSVRRTKLSCWKKREPRCVPDGARCRLWTSGGEWIKEEARRQKRKKKKKKPGNWKSFFDKSSVVTGVWLLYWGMYTWCRTEGRVMTHTRNDVILTIMLYLHAGMVCHYARSFSRVERSGGHT